MSDRIIPSQIRRGRVESESNEGHTYDNNNRRVINIFKRSKSLPKLSNEVVHKSRNIFPDVSPRSLRIAEVKSWETPWNRKLQNNDPCHNEPHHSKGLDLGDQPNRFNDLEPKPADPAKSKRPQLKLKLEDMPSKQQAEAFAQRAARLRIAKRDAGLVSTKGIGQLSPSNGSINLNAYDSEGEVLSPSQDRRHSVYSQWSPDHGRFTTKTVSVSEAGIPSPDATYLHLQHDLVRVKEIGRGASGVVHQCIHIPTLKVVAVKDVPVYGKGQRRQMVRELHALYSNLVPISGHFGPSLPSSDERSSKQNRASPYIVSFYDAYVDKRKNCVCLVMEYMGLGSLQDIVLKGGCSNESLLSRMAYCILQGLSHVHNNFMVHRDIKPHNLLVNRLGEVKISDFGLATTLNDTTSKAKDFVGTLLYMAPERIGGGDYSYAADIWSFGLSLISVALGRYPLPTGDGFFGLVDSVVDEDCLKLPSQDFSQECRDFIEQCLRIDPDERPTADALLTHPFITSFEFADTYSVWKDYVYSSLSSCLPLEEIKELADAVYGQIYQNTLELSFQSQTDYGGSMISRFSLAPRRSLYIYAVEKSLQLGLSMTYDVSPNLVYDTFEERRHFYNSKLNDQHSFSPQSWTASPGYARHQQLFGSDSDSPDPGSRNKRSMWKRLQDRVKKFGMKKEKTEGRQFSSITGGL